MKVINFKCPDCGCNQLCVYGFDYLDGGDILGSKEVEVLDYGCAECGFCVGNTEAETIKWLTEKGVLQNDDI